MTLRHQLFVSYFLQNFGNFQISIKAGNLHAFFTFFLKILIVQQVNEVTSRSLYLFMHDFPPFVFLTFNKFDKKN